MVEEVGKGLNQKVHIEETMRRRGSRFDVLLDDNKTAAFLGLFGIGKGDEKGGKILDGDKKIGSSWWPMKIGEVEIKPKNELETLLEMLDKNNDVYPMSIDYKDREKKWMLFYKLMTLLLLFYFFVPLDLYIRTHIRIGYFGTDYYREYYPFTSMDNNTFTFKL